MFSRKSPTSTFLFIATPSLNPGGHIIPSLGLPAIIIVSCITPSSGSRKVISLSSSSGLPFSSTFWIIPRSSICCISRSTPLCISMIRSKPIYFTTLAGSTYSPSDNIAGISSATSSGVAPGGGSFFSDFSSTKSTSLTDPPSLKVGFSLGIGTSSSSSLSKRSPREEKKLEKILSPVGVSSISSSEGIRVLSSGDSI